MHLVSGWQFCCQGRARSPGWSRVGSKNFAFRTMTQLRTRCGAQSTPRNGARGLNCRNGRGWSRGLAGDFAHEYFLRWLHEIFAESSLSRDACGDHPYARVQLLRYDQAENASWSHVVLAGLNEGVWPPAENESPFLSDDQVA